MQSSHHFSILPRIWFFICFWACPGIEGNLLLATLLHGNLLLATLLHSRQRPSLATMPQAWEPMFEASFASSTFHALTSWHDENDCHLKKSLLSLCLNNSTHFMPGARLHSYAWLAAPWFVSASALAFFLKALSMKDGFKDATWSHTANDLQTYWLSSRVDK